MVLLALRIDCLFVRPSGILALDFIVAPIKAQQVVQSQLSPLLSDLPLLLVIVEFIRLSYIN